MPTKSAPVRAPKQAAHPLRDAADALYRTARESCHQHQRLRRLHEQGADDIEYNAACEVTAICDRLLAEQIKRYEGAAEAGRGKEPEDWWHAANALWMASRDYGRRSATSDAVARFKRHDSAQFGEIAMGYELEMSARLAMKQAIEAYGVLRPDAA